MEKVGDKDDWKAMKFAFDEIKSFLTTFAEKIRVSLVGEVEGMRVELTGSHTQEVNYVRGKNDVIDDLLAQLKDK